MFVFGNHIYTHSIRKVVAFNYNEVIKGLEILQDFIQRKKKGYFVGYLTYECGVLLQFHNISNQAHINDRIENEAKIPLLYFELFKHKKKLQKRIKIKQSNKKRFSKKSLFSIQKPLDEQRYQNDFMTIKANIADGHSYQINYTQEMKLKQLLPLTSWQYFQLLLNKQNTRYKAYIKNEFLEILSFSPELFFRIKNHTITVQPMKGTIKRAYKNCKTEQMSTQNLSITRTQRMQLKKEYRQAKKHEKDSRIHPKKDLEHILTLANDEKNRSENVMIVDLLRNDLSRIALQNSLRVKKLFSIHTYRTLHQMTSTLQAKLPKHFTLLEVLQSLFPCGSITGAPKLKTMELINALEKRQRGVYCGAIGVICAKKILFNIPIRTLTKYNTESFYRYGVGSGVVWDSIMQEEFHELQLKHNFLFS